jgi:hypothetical protein
MLSAPTTSLLGCGQFHRVDSSGFSRPCEGAADCSLALFSVVEDLRGIAGVGVKELFLLQHVLVVGVDVDLAERGVHDLKFVCFICPLLSIWSGDCPIQKVRKFKVSRKYKLLSMGPFQQFASCS